jgi:hypothetical protein
MSLYKSPRNELDPLDSEILERAFETTWDTIKGTEPAIAPHFVLLVRRMKTHPARIAKIWLKQADNQSVGRGSRG